jgi:signal transduction histidine kinase
MQSTQSCAQSGRVDKPEPISNFGGFAVSNKDRERRGTVGTHRTKPKSSVRGNILIFDNGVGLDLLSGPQRRAQSQLIEAERMSSIGRMACSISHDMRHSLAAIYANAEFLERPDLCAGVRADLLFEI